jgi:hypothetical protein
MSDKISGPDGFTAAEIFEAGVGCTGFTYDDLILMPGGCSRFVRVSALCESVYVFVFKGHGLGSTESTFYNVLKLCSCNDNSKELVEHICRRGGHFHHCSSELDQHKGIYEFALYTTPQV